MWVFVSCGKNCMQFYLNRTISIISFKIYMSIYRANSVGSNLMEKVLSQNKFRVLGCFPIKLALDKKVIFGIYVLISHICK